MLGWVTSIAQSFSISIFRKTAALLALIGPVGEGNCEHRTIREVFTQQLGVRSRGLAV